MFRLSALILAVLGSLCLPGQAVAQALPPAGSAGAGNSPISGVPYGAANPRSLSDPSGIGNASSVPSLRSNYGAYTSTPAVSSVPSPRVSVAPVYEGSSPIISPRGVEPKGKAPARRHGRPQVSTFTGICRGC